MLCILFALLDLSYDANVNICVQCKCIYIILKTERDELQMFIQRLKDVINPSPKCPSG